jgi:hypothetical protein
MVSYKDIIEQFAQFNNIDMGIDAKSKVKTALTELMVEALPPLTFDNYLIFV